ncbi:hypothetical protein K3H50_19710 [Aeromonas veronii]|uniref:hypothetical protein n=1 Tax=Aeromonas TaxID=642 RepID=UPI0012385CD7|nr:hypothetical protein [Aeromonas veronii]MCF5865551.1 hypothetical protein [Aeromonas veronii]QET79233.1 hypothetical protein FOB40_08105 [Aeromonas veronii]HDO1314286.1 hypothetical protein [Aeromonas veronii]
MGSQTVWLPTALYTALIRMQLNDFTAQECVIAVFGDKIERLSQQRRYGLIYRNLNKLVDIGILDKRNVGNKCLRPNYIKTAMFEEVTFQEYLLDPEIPVTQVEKKAVVEVRNEGLRELEARARTYRLELQEYQATFAEYCELRTDFPALETTIDNVLRHTCQEFRFLRGRLAAVEEVMRALGRS